MIFGQNAVFHVLGFDQISFPGTEHPSDSWDGPNSPSYNLGCVFPGEPTGQETAAAIQDRVDHQTVAFESAQHCLSVYCNEGGAWALHSAAEAWGPPLESSWADRDQVILASKTELVAGSPVDVRLDKDPYYTPVPVRVPTREATLNYFAESPEAAFQPEPADDDESATTYSCTPLCDVPYQIKHHLRRPCTPRRFYEEVWPDIQALGIESDCGVIERWFRAMSIGADEHLEVSALEVPPPPFMPVCPRRTPHRRAGLAQVVHNHLGPTGVQLDPSRPQGGGGNQGPALDQGLEKVVQAIEKSRDQSAAESRRKKLAEVRAKERSMAAKNGGPDQMAYYRSLAGVQENKDHTEGFRAFLAADSNASGSTILRNGAKKEAIKRGWSHLRFHCYDSKYAEDMKKGSHRVSTRDPLTVGTTMNLLRSGDVSASLTREADALADQWTRTGVPLTKAQIKKISEVVLRLPLPRQATHTIRRHLCLSSFIWGPTHWSTMYLEALDKEVRRLMEEDVLYDSPLREPNQWPLVDTYVLALGTYTLGDRVKAIEEEVDEMDQPVLNPYLVGQRIDRREYWQPIIRDSVAQESGFSDFITYVRATHARPSPGSPFGVMQYTSPVALAIDDASAGSLQSQVASLRAENASLRGAVTAQLPGAGDGVSVLGSVTGTATGSPPVAGERAKNPNFDAGLFGWARDAARAGPPAPRYVASAALKRFEAVGKVPPLPRSRVEPSEPMCFSWHVVGQCNSSCKRARDHVAYAHDSPQYVKLARWARVCYKPKAELEAALPIRSLE